MPEHPPRPLPVLVGAGQTVDRPEDPAAGREPLLLMQEAARRAAEDAGVAILAPFSETDYTAADFADGYHLNERGAARYTRQLSDALRGALGEQS